MDIEKLLEQNKNKDNGITVPDNWKDFSYDAEKFAIPEHYKPFLGTEFNFQFYQFVKLKTLNIVILS